jgi:hypothetical protein
VRDRRSISPERSRISAVARRTPPHAPHVEERRGRDIDGQSLTRAASRPAPANMRAGQTATGGRERSVFVFEPRHPRAETRLMLARGSPCSRATEIVDVSGLGIVI